MVLAAILFIKRSSETTQILAVDESTETEGSHHSLVGKEVPKGVMVYRMMGAFFFGAVGAVLIIYGGLRAIYFTLLVEIARRPMK